MVSDPSRSATGGLADLNVVVISPYSGIIGDLMTKAEPLLLAAAQEIENSSFLPGYRLNVHLADSKCVLQEATRVTIEALISGPTKHAILGDSCSPGCGGANDAAQLFNVPQVSPGCDSPGLSDRTRYPYFTRMTPSDRFKVTAIYEVMKALGFQRVGLVAGLPYTFEARDFFLELMQRDLDGGAYPWTLLLSTTVITLEEAASTAEEARIRDSRINLMVIPEFSGMWLLCQFYLRSMLPPDYVWFVAAFGNWVDGVTASVASTPELRPRSCMQVTADSSHQFDGVCHHHHHQHRHHHHHHHDHDHHHHHALTLLQSSSFSSPSYSYYYVNIFFLLHRRHHHHHHHHHLILLLLMFIIFIIILLLLVRLLRLLLFLLLVLVLLLPGVGARGRFLNQRKYQGVPVHRRAAFPSFLQSHHQRAVPSPIFQRPSRTVRETIDGHLQRLPAGVPTVRGWARSL